MGNFLIRSLVAAVGIPALLWIFHRGGIWIDGFVSVLLVLGCVEVGRAARISRIPAHYGFLALLALPIPWYVWPHGGSAWVVWIVAAFVLSAVWVIWRRDPRTALVSAVTQLTVALWLGVGFGALSAIRQHSPDQGFLWLVFLFANLWVGDTVAYLAGSAIGGPRLSPVISPKKTIAGAVAQVAGSALVGIVFVYGDWLAVPATPVIVAALTIGVVGQIGDLFESTFKRAAGIKDFSSIIPGHGGVLDRFDSALFAAPALWVILQFWPS